MLLRYTRLSLNVLSQTLEIQSKDSVCAEKACKVMIQEAVRCAQLTFVKYAKSEVEGKKRTTDRNLEA